MNIPFQVSDAKPTSLNSDVANVVTNAINNPDDPIISLLRSIFFTCLIRMFSNLSSGMLITETEISDIVFLALIYKVTLKN